MYQSKKKSQAVVIDMIFLDKMSAELLNPLGYPRCE